MKNTIIHLIGFPGTGKYTIAKELLNLGDFRLIDNQLINHPVFSVIALDGKTPLPRRVWDNIAQIRNAVFDTMIHISPKNFNFIFTNVMFDNNAEDAQHFINMKKMAAARGAKYVPVRLLISVEENAKRISMPERGTRLKENRAAKAYYNAENYEVLKPNHPNALELDVTTLSALDAAKIILDHAA